MPNRGMVVKGPDTTSPVWMGDFGSRDHILPAGGRIDAAAIVADSSGRKFVPSGTLVGRTLAERDTVPPTPYGLWAAGDEEVYLIVHDVHDAAVVDEIELYRHGSLVKENYLPGWAGLSAPTKAAIRANYTCIVGVD